MIVVLTGGTGGAKFVDGLRQLVPAKDLTIIVNTGDDLEWWGLYVSPDLDSITYVLAGLLSKERGWGVKGDTFFCQWEHIFGQRLNMLHKVCVRVIYRFHAFSSAITEEINWSFVEIFLISVAINDVSLNWTYFFQSSVIYLSIDFHSSSIEHRYKKSILFTCHFAKKYWDGKNFQGRNAYKFYITTITNTFGH
jgi:hypothetical protein